MQTDWHSFWRWNMKLELVVGSKGRWSPEGWCWVTDRGREREVLHRSRKLLLLAGTTEKTEEVRNNVDNSRHAGRQWSGQRVIHHNVDPTEQDHIYRGIRTDVEVVKTKRERGPYCFFFLSLHGENEGAEGLRYALLGGLSVPQRADWPAAHEGRISETATGRLHQPLQEGYARTFWLCQRHWVLQQRWRVARVRLVYKPPPPLPCETCLHLLAC